MFRHSRAVLAAGIPLLIVLGTLSPLTTQAADIRLGDDVIPVFQSVELRLDSGTADYTGSTLIELKAQRKTDTFQFHAEAMDLQTLSLKQGDNLIGLSHVVDDAGVVTCTAERPLEPGDYTLEIVFADDFNTDAVSLYRMEKDGIGYAFTQFEADDGREAFPMWDEPIFKIPFQLTLSVPEDHLAVTNTPVESETVTDGWRTTVFQKTKPLPSYLLAIATGPLETVEMPGLGVPGRIVTVKGQSHLTELAIAMTPPLLKALEDYFGSKYPYEKCDLIAIPEYWPGAMENPGAITYADGILLLDPATATIGQKRLLARVTAHELAHMWFGDLVTMEWWDDLWLNESFADWMGDKIADQVFPENKHILSTGRDIQQVMLGDARPSTVAIRRPVVSTDNLMEDVGLAYNKGKAVLAMIEQWTGEENFRKGVVSYINANAWGNATAADLWHELDKASGVKISQALAGFIEQPGLPIVSIESLDDGKFRISQRRFRNLGADLEELTWQIPVSLKYGTNGKVKTQTILLEETSTTVDLGKDIDWIYPHAGGNGYYRWSLSSEMMAALNERITTDLNSRERIACLGNLGALLMAGEADGGTYLAAINRLSGDKEPLVMSSVLDALSGVKMAFVPLELEDAFALYVRQTLGPALNHCGLTARAGEDDTMPLLRSRLIGWLGEEGRDEKIASFAKEQADAYLAGEDVDPGIASVCLRLAAMKGDRELFEEFRTRVETAESPTERSRFLGVMGRFEDADLQDAALTYALEGPLRPTEMFSIPRGIGQTNAGRDRMFDWMTTNYDTIIGRVPPMFAGFMPRFASGCSEERLKKASVFFSDPKHQGAGTEKQLAKVSDEVNDCLGLREREGEAVERYLQGLTREP